MRRWRSNDVDSSAISSFDPARKGDRAFPRSSSCKLFTAHIVAARVNELQI